jgi:nucleotide-binding universal stress UspA family protein
MSYKTILVHCDASKTASQQMAVATQLTERFGAHLIGLHARRPFESPNYIDIGVPMGPLLDAYEQSVNAEQAAAELTFGKSIKGKHLATEWRVVDGYADDELAMNARYADLLVVGQSDRRNVFPIPGDLPEAVALATGRPVLVVPQIGVAKPPGRVVMLCWNASRESARAATDAMPFLKEAKEVIVLIVDPHTSVNGHGAEPGADVATWLSRHSVKITVQRDVASDTDVGNVILSRAADHGADLIVMGVYGHSRLREMVLGGVSRTLLSSMTVPVLMSH